MAAAIHESVGDSIQLNSPRQSKHGRDIPDCFSGTGYTVFACVRNPYDRTYSHFRFRRDGKLAIGRPRAFIKNFTRYVAWATKGSGRRINTRPQHWYLARADNPVVIKFEDLPHCFYNLEFLPRGISLPHVNGNSSDDWRQHYNEDLADRVYRFSSKDFELFGYDRDSWNS